MKRLLLGIAALALAVPVYAKYCDTQKCTYEETMKEHKEACARIGCPRPGNATAPYNPSYEMTLPDGRRMECTQYSPNFGYQCRYK